VVLDASRTMRGVAQTFDRSIVQIYLIYLGTGSNKRFSIHSVSVVLGRDCNAASYQIFHRVVTAAMSEFQFICFSTKRVRQHLVA
jgi:hypothetical protein